MAEKRQTFAFLIGLVAGGIFACAGSDNKTTRRGQGAQVPTTTCLNNTNKSTCQSQTPPASTPVATTSLPSYMLDLEELKALSPIVLPYEEPSTTPESLVSYTPFSSVRDALEKNSNTIMAIKDLTPGRQVDVSVIEDESLNAAANGWQQVIVNTGAIKYATEPELLSVICHELAHSARNHTEETITYLSEDKNAATLWSKHEASGNAYLTKTYSVSKGTYTHNSALFAQAKADFDAFRAMIEPHKKHQEAEADAVGAIICAKAGMPVAKFSDHISAFLAKTNTPLPQDAVEFKDLKDGDVVKVPFEYVWDFVFSISSHPSDSERKSQLTVLAPGLTSFESPSVTLANSWVTSIKQARSSIALIALTSFSDASSAKRIETVAGVTVRMPQKSCTGLPHSFTAQH